MGAREKNKQARRERILAAALRLLERGGAEALTMRGLARTARVSEMTPYNLFGSKGGVIEALFQAAVDGIVERTFAQTPADPLERLFVSAEVLADTWTEGSGRFRELMRAARESGTDLTPGSKGPISGLHATLGEAAAAGMITEDVPLADLAHHIFVANQGAYQPWVAGEIDDSTLRRTLIVGLSISLLGVATPRARKRILARLSSALEPSAPRRRGTSGSKRSALTS